MTARTDLPSSAPLQIRAAVVSIALLVAGLMIWFALAAGSLAPSAGSGWRPVPVPAPPPLERGHSPR
jgi:hypothetical protein